MADRIDDIDAARFGSARPITGSEHDKEWYKRAVFYEVLVRAFADSNGDGTGDLRGLIDKLDYLAWLGRRLPVAAAVLRFAAARRRVRHPRLPQGAARVRHRRGLRRRCWMPPTPAGIRVITDLVMNHT